MEKTRSHQKISRLKVELQNVEEQLSNNKEMHIKKVESEAIEKIKANPKSFYRYAKSKSVVRSNIGPLLNNKGDLTSHPKDMTEILSNQYSGVFSDPEEVFDDIFAEPDESEDNISLDQIVINDEIVEKAIKELVNGSVPGPDGVCPEF